MTITPDRTFTEQDGTLEDAEVIVTPALPHPDVQGANDYIDTLPTELRGRELALQVVYIAENFPQYHDQESGCSANSACLVGWTDVLAAKPLMDKLDIEIAIHSDTRSYSGESHGLLALFNKGWWADCTDPVTYAAKMLGIPEKYSDLGHYVYGEMDTERAIHNFKILTGLVEGVLN